MQTRNKCYVCGMPIDECVCDDEDWEDDGETEECDDLDENKIVHLYLRLYYKSKQAMN